MMKLDDARALLQAEVSALPPRSLELAEAFGCRLAAAVRAELDLPPSDVSAMDGYAVRAADLVVGGALPVTMESAAGSVPAPLAEGTAARIFTGAVLPRGADSVVPQECAERIEADGRLAVHLPEVRAGHCVRAGGEVFRRGQVLLAAAARLDPSSIALVSASGGTDVEAYPRPRVGILATGSEILAGGVKERAGTIRDSNTPMLAALCADARLDLVHTGSSPDDMDTLTSSLERALAAAEVVVTTGGVSVGDHDLVPRAAEMLGARTLVHGIAMRPGKPILVAQVGERWLVGLPGNPLSALVGWRVIVRPLAEALAGDRLAFVETPVRAHPVAPIENPAPRLLLRPARLSVTARGLSVAALPWKGSHDLFGPAALNALVRVEPESSAPPARGTLGCYPLPWRIDPDGPFDPGERTETPA